LSAPLYDYRAPDFVATDLGGNDITSSVTALTTVYAQRIQLTFTNANTTYAAVVRNLSISGSGVVGGRGEERVFDSGASYWSGRPPRVRSVRSNLYIQSEVQAASMGAFLRDRFETPRRWWKIIGTTMPSLELGAPVYIYDTLMGMSTTAHQAHGFITARQWTANAAGYGETLEYVDREGLFAYALTTPGYFVIGTNKLGTADAARGRVFHGWQHPDRGQSQHPEPGFGLFGGARQRAAVAVCGVQVHRHAHAHVYDPPQVSLPAL